MSFKKIFMTGATGFVGIPLAMNLAGKGYQVHALVRSSGIARKELNHPNIQIFEGNLSDQRSLSQAMEGCDEAFHLAAHTGIWTKNPGIYYKINVEGTENVCKAAKKAGIKRLVKTSTAGVMGHSPQRGVLVREHTNQGIQYETEYEKSKVEAEKVAFSYNNDDMKVVVVNPTRIYGPGPIKESNSIVRLIQLYRNGKWRLIPGDGKSMGNYVYIEDVVQGHLLAKEKGQAGERYILGGSNLSYDEFFQAIRNVTGCDYQLFKIPLRVMRVFAHSQVLLAHTLGTKPLVVPAYVEKLSKDWSMSSAKAESELGYQPIPFEEGLKKTYAWLQEQNLG